MVYVNAYIYNYQVKAPAESLLYVLRGWPCLVVTLLHSQFESFCFISYSES